MEREITDLVRRVINDLSDGNYDAAVSQAATSRLTAADLQRVIADYGRTPVRPPEPVFDTLDIVRVRSARPKWSVRVPLWTQEEGRSDLTLELTIEAVDGMLSVTLDDLHVL